MKPAKAILVPAIVVLLIDDTAACVGTTPALEYERYGFLLQAAQAGIDRAANAYFLEGPGGHSTGDPLPAEWTGNTIKFLQAAATQGDTTSMSWAVSDLREGPDCSGRSAEGTDLCGCGLGLQPRSDFGGERCDQAKERRTHSRSSPTGGQSRK